IAGVYAFLVIPTPAVIPTFEIKRRTESSDIKEESLLIPTFADIKEKYPRHAEPVEAHTSPQSSILHLPSSSNTPYYKSNTSVIPTFEIKRRTESSDTKEESLPIPTFADIKEKYPRHAEPIEAHTSPQSSILHLPSSSNTPYYKSNTSVIPTFEIKRRTESSDTKEESLPIPTFADIKEKYPRHAEPIEAHTSPQSSIL